MPSIEYDAEVGLAYADCPGFGDNRGAEVNIANACNIKRTIDLADSVRVLILINYSSIDSNRGLKDAPQKHLLLPCVPLSLGGGPRFKCWPPFAQNASLYLPPAGQGIKDLVQVVGRDRTG